MNLTTNPCVKGSFAFDRSWGEIVDMMSAPKGLDAPSSPRRVKAGEALDGLVRQGLQSTIRSRMVAHPTKREIFEPYSDDPSSPQYVSHINRKLGEKGVTRIIAHGSGPQSGSKGSKPHYVSETKVVYTAADFSNCLVTWGSELEERGFLTPELIDWLERSGEAFLRGSKPVGPNFGPDESATWGDILNRGVFEDLLRSGRKLDPKNTMSELRKNYGLLAVTDDVYLLRDVQAAALRRQRRLHFSMKPADQGKAAVTEAPGLQNLWRPGAG